MSRITKRFLSKNRNKQGDKDESCNTADLDEEMEKVFSMSENEKFDLTRFTVDDSEEKSQRRYTEGEFHNSHRKRSYPHIHLPIKGLKSHLPRKSNAFNLSATINQNNGKPEKECFDENDKITEEEKKEFLLYDDSCKEPVLSHRAAVQPARDSESPDRRVQFNIESAESEPLDEFNQKNGESHKTISERKLKRKHSHHYKKTRKHSSDSSKYKKTNSIEEAEAEEGSYKLILQLEEPLQEFVQDDLTSHRFDCARDKRRFSAKSRISAILNRKGTESSIISALPLKIYKKSFDHSPHEVFVQLDELTGAGEEREWKETARWIKYEEDVEEGTDRWGRPHVASLSFHSLLNLRRCLETGVVLLDLEEKELPGVAYRVVEQMAIDQLIKEEEKSTIMRALLLRHRHVNYHERFRFMRRNTSSYTSLQGMEEVTSGHAAFTTNNVM